MSSRTACNATLSGTAARFLVRCPIFTRFAMTSVTTKNMVQASFVSLAYLAAFNRAAHDGSVPVPSSIGVQANHL